MQDFAFPFADLHKNPIGPFLKPFVVPVSGGTTVWCINCSSLFCIIWKIAEYALCPITKSLVMMLSSYHPTINPWGTSVVTEFQLDFVLLITTFWDWQFSQFSGHLIVCIVQPLYSKQAQLDKLPRMEFSVDKSLVLSYLLPPSGIYLHG